MGNKIRKPHEQKSVLKEYFDHKAAKKVANSRLNTTASVVLLSGKS